MNRAARGAWMGLVPLVLAGACATKFYLPPTGPGAPFAEAATVWRDVTARCLNANRFVAEITVNGWVGEGESRQSVGAPIHGALTRDDDIYLEVPAPGRSYVQMAGRAGQAVFLLPRDERYLRAASRDVVEALTGLLWGPKDFLNVLSGCVTTATGDFTGVRYGETAAIELGGDAKAWVRQQSGVWQLEAATRDRLLIEYRAREGAFPSDIRVSSMAGSVTPLQLRFAIKQVQVNIDLTASTFVLDVPASFSPITIAELRSNRPLKDGKDGEPSVSRKP
jgi:hypothetical protein